MNGTMDYKIVTVTLTYDNRQQIPSDFAQRVLMLLQNNGYWVGGVNDLPLIQSTFNNGAFVNGEDQINVFVGVPHGTSNSAVGAAIAALIQGITVLTSSTALTVTSTTVTNATAPPGAGAPDPNAAPSPGNP